MFIGSVKDKHSFMIAAIGKGADGDLAPYIISIQEGDGEGLEPEDMEAGYVHYIDYTIYFKNEDCNEPEFTEWDGGMELLEQPYESLSVREIISHVLYAAYGNNADDVTVIIL